MISFFMLLFQLYFQTQRKLEMEADNKRKVEYMLKDKEKQLELEINTRLQMSTSTAHSTEKMTSLERSVCCSLYF